jgi:long-subunit acyl-CoA synthetase (AMP-forming)
LIRQAILVGDHRPFIAALIVPERGRIAAALDRVEMV